MAVLKETLVASIFKKKITNGDDFTSRRTEDAHPVYYQDIIPTQNMVFRKKPKLVGGKEP